MDVNSATTVGMYSTTRDWERRSTLFAEGDGVIGMPVIADLGETPTLFFTRRSPRRRSLLFWLSSDIIFL